VFLGFGEVLQIGFGCGYFLGFERGFKGLMGFWKLECNFRSWVMFFEGLWV
jgi:hypothetical protein